ncbi:MAG: tRNA uridine(34) 5-carboxymethylaminomethyl modification radical SAM/GNAT enzyme Elp3 [Candidatus Aenigmarchaeota archaeon ex4484_52]|nr:MAG: tRNA uridine(34) 5-carboxymethylaminomethyl modification radical SAM/GNAT enzyme Elp3 [Candidatus Aenigmarchaeota archaeon ex4484_52]
MLIKDKSNAIKQLKNNPLFEKEILNIISKIKNKQITQKQLMREKQILSKKFNLDFIIPNSLILEYNVNKDVFVNNFLIKKKIRTISGVAIIAVMIKPHKCPGKCIYCPNSNIAPKSYTGLEPATRRAIMFNFDPYLQVKNRLEQLNAIGHSTEKIEIIIMGGTFLSLSKKYQINFVKNIFDSLNDKKSKNLDDAKKTNETAKHRCVGLTIETRPDFCDKEQIKQMLYLGATRVELGVQILNNKIYKKTNRGHTIKDVAKATELLKNSGLKILYHIMPGLGTKKNDLDSFKLLFSDERFFPDMLKIYPVLVIEGTELHNLWKQKKYKALDIKKAVELICEFKKQVPEFVRIMRVQRDISKEKIIAGVDAGNLRELIEKQMQKQYIKCRCIRCREAGHNIYKKNHKIHKNNIELKYIKYIASGSEEYFIYLIDKKQDILFGYLRLRILNKNCKIITKEITKNSAIIRELKVFGTSTPLGDNYDFSFQHRGFGKLLIKKAEELTKKANKNKLLVMSAVGTKQYYEKFGFEKDGVYMSKIISQTKLIKVYG